MTVQDDLMQVMEQLSDKLRELTPGTEEYTTVFNQYIKVEEKIADLEETAMENDRKDREMAEHKKERHAKYGTDIGKTVFTTAVFVGVTFVMMYWEEDNTFTGIAKAWASKVAPSKLF